MKISPPLYIASALLAAALLHNCAARAHDAEHPENNAWMMALQNGAGVLCCEISDTNAIKDVPWDTYKDNQGFAHYEVMVENTWLHVDDSLVVREPNKLGVPIVWIYHSDGMAKVRCFMPGVGL